MTLPPPQIDAILRYVGGDYVRINGDCRGDASGDPQVHADIFHLDAALGSAVLTKDESVFRGVDRTYAEELERRGLERGDVLVDRGFLSTSRRRIVARRFLGHEPGSLLFRILVPQGMRALDLNPYAADLGEDELLLPRDTMLRVLGYDENEDVLDLEVVDHG